MFSRIVMMIGVPLTEALSGSGARQCWKHRRTPNHPPNPYEVEQMAKAYSSRKRPPRRARIKSPRPDSKIATNAPVDRPDFAEILRRLSDGLALVETAHGALKNAREDETLVSSGVLTLRRGIDELQGAYTDFDIAVSQWQP